MLVLHAANHTSAAHLPNRQIEQKFNRATNREDFPGANIQAAHGEVVEIRDTTKSTGLPGCHNAFGRRNAGITSLIWSNHTNPFVGENFRRAGEPGLAKSSVKFKNGWRLVFANPAGRDLGLEIILTANGSARQTAKDSQLADVVQRIRKGPLKQFFG